MNITDAVLAGIYPPYVAGTHEERKIAMSIKPADVRRHGKRPPDAFNAERRGQRAPPRLQGATS